MSIEKLRAIHNAAGADETHVRIRAEDLAAAAAAAGVTGEGTIGAYAIRVARGHKLPGVPPSVGARPDAIMTISKTDHSQFILDTHARLQAVAATDVKT